MSPVRGRSPGDMDEKGDIHYGRGVCGRTDRGGQDGPELVF